MILQHRGSRSDSRRENLPSIIAKNEKGHGLLGGPSGVKCQMKLSHLGKAGPAEGSLKMEKDSRR